MKLSKQALVGKENLRRLVDSEKEYTCDIDNYTTNKTKIEFVHVTCGTKWLIRPNDFSLGKRCPTCAMNSRVATLSKVSPRTTLEHVKKFIESEVGYTLLSKVFINNKAKLTVHHSVCGKEYNVRFNDFQQGYRCPNCAFDPKESKASKEIDEFLTKNNVDFIKEVTFDGLKHKRSLYYDFLIYTSPKKDDYFIIEYHGKQHFVKTSGSKWFTNNRFEIGKVRDKIKEDFAKENKIDLHIISYKEKHIERLVEILEHYKIVSRH